MSTTKNIFGGGSTVTDLSVNSSLTVYGPIVATGDIITNQNFTAASGTLTANAIVSNGNVTASAGTVTANAISCTTSITAGSYIGLPYYIQLNSAANLVENGYVGISVQSLTESTAVVNLPGNFYLTNVTVKLSAAPGADTRFINIRKNGSTTNVISITGTATTGSLTGSVSVAAGDLFCVLATTNAGTAPAASASIYATFISR